MAGKRTSRADQTAFPWRALRTLREILFFDSRHVMRRAP